MYNDEQNLYHYTYRKDDTEPGQHYDAKQPTVDEQLNSYRQQQEQQTQNSQTVYQSQPQGGPTQMCIRDSLRPEGHIIPQKYAPDGLAVLTENVHQSGEQKVL